MRNGCEFFPASDDGKDVKRWMRGKKGERKRGSSRKWPQMVQEPSRPET